MQNLIRIGINGFGRCGRQVYRAIFEKYPRQLLVVAVNDIGDAKTNAHLLKYDSNYGRFPADVDVSPDGDAMVVAGQVVKVLAERDPANIPWGKFGVDIVVESTGLFTDGSKARAHIHDTVRKVVISAPAKNEHATIVLGVNEHTYDPHRHTIISNGSCTTNCIAPVAKVLHNSFGIQKGFMTTIHAYTNDQRILDQWHEDLRRTRAAALSIIPTTTGAARAITQVIPELEGKLDGMAYRVPTPTVSVCDLVATLEKPATKQEVNEAFKDAASEALRDILEYTDEPLVSIDFKGNPASAIVDGLSTMVIGDNMVKVVAWYDNEWGYACRTADLCCYIVQKGL